MSICWFPPSPVWSHFPAIPYTQTKWTHFSYRPLTPKKNASLCRVQLCPLVLLSEYCPNKMSPLFPILFTVKISRPLLLPKKKEKTWALPSFHHFTHHRVHPLSLHSNHIQPHIHAYHHFSTHITLIIYMKVCSEKGPAMASQQLYYFWCWTFERPLNYEYPSLMGDIHGY